MLLLWTNFSHANQFETVLNTIEAFPHIVFAGEARSLEEKHADSEEEKHADSKEEEEESEAKKRGK